MSAKGLGSSGKGRREVGAGEKPETTGEKQEKGRLDGGKSGKRVSFKEKEGEVKLEVKEAIENKK